ncbi:amino acid ABC transporter permease [Roseibaca sp. Y0-43]|uniref:amino acid ABC transporter permease n=1 Tax=Roseibaca sp. Y0-43 TaxID=2816854 RepID=UPI001D0C84CC|nr:amino acid ABC transporter permease [Roseibaca sp. Y0-43]MCC1480860.1 amino acid ABC transporter permease [Roseibaca sp. Y0-43]
MNRVLATNRDRPPVGFNVWRSAGIAWQIAQALVVFAALGWLVWRGIDAMDYRWQWFRVEPFFYREIDGEIIWGPLVRGLILTIQISAIAGALAIVIGFLTALARLSGSFAGRVLAKAYLEAIRNTPLLVQLFLVYFVLAPIIGIERFWAGVLCLALYEGSFAAEIIRGGLRGIDRGQYEAADAVGLTAWDKYRYIIVPQSMPLILPPLTGLLISTIKHSAIVSVIALVELTTQGLNLVSNTFMAFEVWFIVAGIYLALTVSLSFAVSLLEHYLSKPKR